MVWHALASYDAGGKRKSAIVLDGKVYDLAKAFKVVHPRRRSAPSWVTGGCDAALADWMALRGEIAKFATAAAQAAKAGRLGALRNADQRLVNPFMPGRIFCAGANYGDHAREMGAGLQKKNLDNPYFFIKAATAVTGPRDTVCIPPEVKKTDWEVELGVVIGRVCRRTTEARAYDYIAGYTVANDVSARDLNSRSDYPFKQDWFQGKSHDTFAPIGPWLVPKSCIRDPQNLDLSLQVNDDMMQDSNTSEMIFDIREQIAYLSRIVTLLPGDVIFTGTPHGVGAGRGIFLKPGDTMITRVEKIGRMINPVAAEKTSLKAK
jgi:2,4-didehydro-3-deoxy-L-rhamnonate hydrolase